MNNKETKVKPQSIAKFGAKEATQLEQSKNFEAVEVKKHSTVPANVEKPETSSQTTEQSEVFVPQEVKSDTAMPRHVTSEESTTSSIEQAKHFKSLSPKPEKANKKVTFLEELSVKENVDTTETFSQSQPIEEVVVPSIQESNKVSCQVQPEPSDSLGPVETKSIIKQEAAATTAGNFEANETSSSIPFDSVDQVQKVKTTPKTEKVLQTNQRSRKAAMIVAESKVVDSLQSGTSKEVDSLETSNMKLTPQKPLKKEEVQTVSSAEDSKNIRQSKHESVKTKVSGTFEPFVVHGQIPQERVEQKENERSQQTDIGTVNSENLEPLVMSTSSAMERHDVVDVKNTEEMSSTCKESLLPNEGMVEAAGVTIENLASLEMKRPKREVVEEKEPNTFSAAMKETISVQDGVKSFCTESEELMKAAGKNEPLVAITLTDSQPVLKTEKLISDSKLPIEENTSSVESNVTKVIEETSTPDIASKLKIAAPTPNAAAVNFLEGKALKMEEIIQGDEALPKEASEDVVKTAPDITLDTNISVVTEDIKGVGTIDQLKKRQPKARNASKSRENSICIVDDNKIVLDLTKALEEEQPEIAHTSHSREVSLSRLQEEIVKGETLLKGSSITAPVSAKGKSIREPSQTRHQEQVTELDTTSGLPVEPEKRGRARIKDTSSKLSSSKNIKKSVRSLSLGKTESSSIVEEKSSYLSPNEANKETTDEAFQAAEGLEVVSNQAVAETVKFSQNKEDSVKPLSTMQSMSSHENQEQTVLESSKTLGSYGSSKMSQAKEGKRSPIQNVVVDVPITLGTEKVMPKLDDQQKSSEVLIPLLPTSNEENIPVATASISDKQKLGKTKELDAVSVHNDSKQVATVSQNISLGKQKAQSSKSKKKASLGLVDHHASEVSGQSAAIDKTTELQLDTHSNVLPKESSEDAIHPTVIGVSNQFENVTDCKKIPDSTEVNVDVIQQQSIMKGDVSSSMIVETLTPIESNKKHKTSVKDVDDNGNFSIETSSLLVIENSGPVESPASKKISMPRIEAKETHQSTEVKQHATTTEIHEEPTYNAQKVIDNTLSAASIEESQKIGITAKEEEGKKKVRGKPRRDQSLTRTDETVTTAICNQNITIDTQAQTLDQVPEIESHDHRQEEQTFIEHAPTEFAPQSTEEKHQGNLQIDENLTSKHENYTVGESAQLLSNNSHIETKTKVQCHKILDVTQSKTVPEDMTKSIDTQPVDIKQATSTNSERAEIVIETQVETEGAILETNKDVLLSKADTSASLDNTTKHVETHLVSEVVSPLPSNIKASEQGNLNSQEAHQAVSQTSHDVHESVLTLRDNSQVEEQTSSLIHGQNLPTQKLQVQDLSSLSTLQQSSHELQRAKPVYDTAQSFEVKESIPVDESSGHEGSNIFSKIALPSLASIDSNKEMTHGVTQYETTEVPYTKELNETVSIIPQVEASVRNQSNTDETVQHSIKTKSTKRQATIDTEHKAATETGIEEVSILGISKGLSSHKGAKGIPVQQENLQLEQMEDMLLDTVDEKKVCKLDMG